MRPGVTLPESNGLPYRASGVSRRGPFPAPLPSPHVTTLTSPGDQPLTEPHPEDFPWEPHL
jgi:hypothetical protein